MTAFVSETAQRSGVPLGGIGTGSVELWPDGAFHAWQIANPERFCRDCRKQPDADGGEGLAGSLSFFLRTESGNSVRFRRLDLSGADNNCRMYSFLKPVEKIAFSGTFPTAELNYIDAVLPVSVSMNAAVPFVPHEACLSGTPGFYITFSVRNDSGEPVHVSLAAKLKSILRPGSERCRVIREKGCSALMIQSAAETPEGADTGSIALSGSGGKASWIAGAYRSYMDEYVAHGARGVSEESFVFHLYRAGCLPDTEVMCRPGEDLLRTETDSLPDEACRKALSRVLCLPSAADLWERLRCASAEWEPDMAALRADLQYILKNLREMDAGSWGDSALCLETDLLPGEEKELRWILSWYFPGLYSAGGSRVGHWYETRFADAWDANRLLLRERANILRRVKAFTDNLYYSSYPECFADAVSIHLATLVKSAWWTRDGSFGIWEGLGSCGLCTTDISYHGTFGLAALFPELQKQQMRQTAAFQREDGAVMHFFTPDFCSVDDGYDRVDMNPQFVLLVCRDWLATGDRAYAVDMWPHVQAAMRRTESLDRDGGGLPDVETQKNTYDAWRFSGTPVYVAVLWLAALEAAATLADDLGYAKEARAWRALRARGAVRLEKLLWNGAYYDLWQDGEARDESCMTDQLDGECFCRLIGLDGSLSDDRVRTVLNSVWMLNYSPEGGLVNAGCPREKQTALYTFRNCQGEANWSGIEYWMAAFLILTGRYDRALALVQTVQERYRRLGLVWNHAECGDYYYRPLSSFALVQALCAVRCDAATHTLAFAESAQEAFHAPWFAPGAYGQTAGNAACRTVTVVEGALEVERIILPAGHAVKALRLNEAPAAFTQERDSVITLGSRICLLPGDQLIIGLRKKARQ